MAQAIPQAEPGIDQHSLYEKLSFTPHSPAQWDYSLSKTRFNIPCCGRRWGKTQAAARRMTYKSFIPDSYNWIVAPKYALGEKEFRIVYKDYESLGLLKHCRKSYSVKQGDMRIQTPWGSVIQVVSAEKQDSLLGEGLSHAIMSEAAQHSRSTWEQYIEPALSDLLGTCDFPSTPKGFNWYHGLFELGQGAHPQYKSWTFPSWTNPVRYPGGLNNPEIQRLKSLASRSYFDQEYGAKFTSMAGAIYDEWDERIHVRKHIFNPTWENFLAFDYGYVNPFVALDIQVSPSQDTIYVWREYFKSYISTYENAQALQHRNKHNSPPGYRIDGMWGDPRGADEAATLALVLGFVASEHVGWKLSVEEIKRRLKPNNEGECRLYIDPSCVNLIREMSQLRVKETVRQRTQDLQEFTDDGNIQHKIDDHGPDALRYFVGPYYVMGHGTHLEDVYGENYRGSESEDFFKLHNQIELDSDTSSALSSVGPF